MPKKKRTQPKKNIINRRARFDYSINDTYMVGLVLTGAETKALRLGQGQLTGSYVTIKDNQLLLINTLITGTKGIPISEQDQTRSRRLLAKRREIDHLIQAKVQGRTIIPLELLTHGRYIKLKIAVAQGKKNYDKRQTLKARSEQRQIDNAIKTRR
jgi:SsrA-binding protein